MIYVRGVTVTRQMSTRHGEHVTEGIMYKWMCDQPNVATPGALHHSRVPLTGRLGACWQSIHGPKVACVHACISN